MRRPLLTLFKVLLGVGLGLGVAEFVFAKRAQHAFAHVNFYEADAQLGTRLRPHAQMKIAFGGNAVTELHTNERGFRGDAWPAPTARDVLVVGDSQVFGLGVNDADTFTRQLEKLLPEGTHVLNAGVPTYGPQEYTTLVERLVAERKPDAVVYVLNLANDLFEASRPNTERHAVWDGWAVRKETAPARVWEFPGRAWLMSQSHAMYALRQLIHASELEAAVFASEGAWNDVVGASRSTPQAPSDSLRAALSKVTGTPATPPDAHALDEVLARTKRACDAVDARLLVVALPLDVQVSPDEWKKYGHAPIDMSATAVLGQDVVRRAELQGALALDATAALAAAEPGAFLLGDLHMSAKGHAALARALATKLRGPQPYERKLPLGRSALPSADEWAAVGHVGEELHRCRLAQVREWWQVTCLNREGDGIGDDITGVTLHRGGHGEAFVINDYLLSYANGLTLTLPVLPGDDVQAVLSWQHRRLPLRSRTVGGTTVLEFGESVIEEGTPGVFPEGLAVQRSTLGTTPILEAKECAQSKSDWDENCQLLVDKACAGDLLAFGAIRRCVPRCSRDIPCKTGRCALWNGERGCVAP